MSETDPRNPYGPNYIVLDFDTKMYYKFLRMRNYVQVSEEDNIDYLNLTSQFYASMMGVACTTIFSTILFNRLVVRALSKRMYQYIKERQVYFGGFLTASVVTLSYDEANVYFTQNYCIDFMEKYKTEAVTNGFEDYDISGTMRVPTKTRIINYVSDLLD